MFRRGCALAVFYESLPVKSRCRRWRTDVGSKALCKGRSDVIRRVSALLLSIVFSATLGCLLSPPASAAPFAYITDAARNQIVIIDARTNRVTGAVARSFSTGTPRSLAVEARKRGLPIGAKPNERQTFAVSLCPCASPLC